MTNRKIADCENVKLAYGLMTRLVSMGQCCPWAFVCPRWEMSKCHGTGQKGRRRPTLRKLALKRPGSKSRTFSQSAHVHVHT